METVNIHDAKTRLSQLIARVLEGEEIVIAKAGTPVARLVPIDDSGEARRGGAWKGLVRMGDDFDAPLPDGLADAFGVSR